MLCPFCMKQHPHSAAECPEKRVRIPAAYIEDSKRGVPIVAMLTIGYSGHGKTCFLSSFFHSLYHGHIADKWPGFSFIGLTMDTLNRIHNEYVNILDHGHLPPKTPIMFPTPLILKFQRMPLNVRSMFKKYIKRVSMEQDELIVIFYDIGGGTFDLEAKIRQNVPILNEINTLVFLISLPRILEEVRKNTLVVQRMHKLLNTIVLAMKDPGQQKNKDLVVCFTMGDEMWDSDDHIYGQLGIPINHPMPYLDGFRDYFSTLLADSEIICQHIQEEYTPFYNALMNNFRHVRFTSISSLGSHPTEKGKIEHLSPMNVFDPLLSLLEFEGHL